MEGLDNGIHDTDCVWDVELLEREWDGCAVTKKKKSSRCQSASSESKQTKAIPKEKKRQLTPTHKPS